MAKKYYWLKLKQDFFDNLRMKKLRSIAGGDTYTIIYLKLQLLSLQDEGYLFYEGVEETFEQELALIINENIEDVKIAINFLKSNNLIQEIEEGKYELVETRTCIGSETDKAELMRKLRDKRKQELIQNSNNVTNLLPNVTKCYTEIDKEIDIEKELQKDVAVAKITESYQENIGMITPAVAELLLSYLKDFNYEVIIKAIEIATLQNKRKMAYINGILKDWKNKGYKVLADIKGEKKNNKNKAEQREYTEKDFNNLYVN